MLAYPDNTINHNNNSHNVDKYPLLNNIEEITNVDNIDADIENNIMTTNTEPDIENNIISINNTDNSDDNHSIEHQDSEQNCPICFEHTIDNILFDCNHSICLNCLQSIYWAQGKKRNISCPICRSEIEAACEQESETNSAIVNINETSLESSSESSYTIRSMLFWTLYLLFIIIICFIGMVIIQFDYNNMKHSNDDNNIYQTTLLTIIF